MNRYIRAVAMLPADAERTRWLCLLDPNRNQLEFVTGEPQRDESFRECVQRESCDALGLAPRELLVASVAQINLDVHDVLPGDFEASHITVAFFLVHPYRNVARQKVNAHPQAYWLSGRELLEGADEDVTSVDPILHYLLRRSEVIQAW